MIQSRTFRLLFIAFSVVTLSISSSGVTQALDVTFYSGNNILYSNPEEACISSSTDFNSALTVVQANIKSNNYKKAFGEILQKKPDFISLNEVTKANLNDITPKDYSSYRDSSAKGLAKSTAVMWNNRWSKVDAGRVIMVAKGPQKWDDGRSATWVTVTDNNGNTASMISLHHMINPRNFGPNKPLRKDLYKKGIERVVEKIKELSSRGPVVIGGDFNTQYKDNDSWGPRKAFNNIGVKSTFDKLGATSTHVRGGTIDYIFYSKELEAKSQSTIKSSTSDHYFLVAELASKSSSINSKAGKDIKISGSGPEEKAWNYLTGKGLSDEQAAGVIGNLIAESGLDPRAKNGSSYAGIAQWDTGDRFPRLKRWANGKGMSEWSFDAQIQYLWIEAVQRGNIKGMKNHKPQNVSHLAWYWGRHFEVAIIGGDPDKYPHNVQHFKDAREPAAEKIYNRFTGKTAGTAPGSGDGSYNCEGTESDSGADKGIGAGSGDFTDAGAVNGWDIVKANAIKVDARWKGQLEWKGWCASIVARTWQGNPNTGFGYGPLYAMTLWKNHRNLVNTNHKAPKGSILLYTGGTQYGHVTIYLGNNRILNDGHIVDASTKADDYLGWVDPNKLTWQKPQKLGSVEFMGKYR